MEKQNKFSINEIASMYDVSPRTIRYYEEIGLLQSVKRKDQYQQRFFTNAERRRLKLILRGKRMGFKLEEIKEMIDLYESNPTGEKEKNRILEYTDQKLFEIEEKIEDLQRLREEILINRKRFVEE